MAKKIRVERQIGASVYAIETGLLAKQAAGSCLVQYGETVVFAATTTGPPRPGIDFFPLTCEYRERHAAAGKYPGGFLKREGRPSMRETLTSRLIDRPIRPLWPDHFHDEVQIQCNLLASDRQNDSDVLAITAATTALEISPMPFQGPLAAVRLGQIDGRFIPFPTQDDLEQSDLDLVVAGNRDSVLMIEGFAREMPEERMAEAIAECQKWIREVLDLQQELLSKLEIRKAEVPPPPEDDLRKRLADRYYQQLKDVIRGTPGKQARSDAAAALYEQALAEFIPDPAAEGAVPVASLGAAWYQLKQRVIRDLILEGTRPDGRDAKSLRPIECYVDVLPRVHGSAIFQRGETQSLVTVTLGTTEDEQRVDGPFDEYSKKFMLDYYFPPYSVGEVRPIRGPGRREIGHGALAERSVAPVMPDPESFPYTVRVISDIMESNGSSSMASVCGATLGLMAAGVPITNPVAGISIGLVKEGEDRWVLLTDIIGDEDHYGDMDFKIAGTQLGVTGIQLDLKIQGINEAIVRGTLQQAREARLEILRHMLSAIRQPRGEVSPFAPRLMRTKIDPDKIGLLIGPGGKTIRAIQESTGARIEVDDDGTVVVAGSSADSVEAAMAKIEALTANVQLGKIYTGRVTSIKDFGVFVEILPGRDGLCHISELEEGYVSKITDHVNMGDEIKVKVIAIDDHDRVKLSRRAALQELREQAEQANGEKAQAKAPQG